MPLNISPDGIGIEYRIDLLKLAASIRDAKQALGRFHTDVSAMAKKAATAVSGDQTLQNVSQQLRKLGINADTTTGQIKKRLMNVGHRTSNIEHRIKEFYRY